MKLSPGFHEPALHPGEVARHQLDRVEAEHSNRVSVVRMEVRRVVDRTGFHEHADDDAKETADFRHDESFYDVGCQWRTTPSLLAETSAPGGRCDRPIAEHVPQSHELTVGEDEADGDATAAVAITPITPSGIAPLHRHQHWLARGMCLVQGESQPFTGARGSAAHA